MSNGLIILQVGRNGKLKSIMTEKKKQELIATWCPELCFTGTIKEETEKARNEISIIR